MKNASYWINSLNLLPHPEGGYYKETYRSSGKIKDSSLPTNFIGNRAFSTAIYFLLEKGNFSAFHRIKSDELWHFYDGDPIAIHVINNNGILTTHMLGKQPDKGIFPQITIPANSWFASESIGNYSLAGCTVSPGFDFNDFEMADRNKLIGLHSKHISIIEKFTR
jgi:predicted cupin superfamily sugar epimerase